MPLKIGVVDDDRIFQHLLVRQLKKLQYNDIVLFSDGEEAADYFEANASTPESLPDLLFLDLNMPVMDGWNFLAHYARLSVCKHPQIYILSSSNSPTDIEKSRQIGSVHDYLVKPLPQLSLQGILENCAV